MNRKKILCAVLAFVCIAFSADAVWLGDEAYNGIDVLGKPYKQKETTLEGGTYTAKRLQGEYQVYVEGDYVLNFKNSRFAGPDFLIKRGGMVRLEECTIDSSSNDLSALGGSRIEARNSEIHSSISANEGSFVLLENCQILGSGNGRGLIAYDGGRLEMHGGALGDVRVSAGQHSTLLLSGIETAQLSGLGAGGNIDIRDCGSVIVSGGIGVNGASTDNSASAAPACITIENSRVEVQGGADIGGYHTDDKIVLNRGANLTVRGETLLSGIIEISGGASLDLCGGFYTIEGENAQIYVDGVPQNIEYAEELHLASQG